MSETKQCIKNLNCCEVIEVERQGFGSLAEAINCGMQQVNNEFAWIITNVVFSPGTLQTLLNAIQQSNPALFRGL